MFHVDVNMNRLGIGFRKTTGFNDSESTFLLGDDNFIHGVLSDLKHCRMFSFT